MRGRVDHTGTYLYRIGQIVMELSEKVKTKLLCITARNTSFIFTNAIKRLLGCIKNADQLGTMGRLRRMIS